MHVLAERDKHYFYFFSGYSAPTEHKRLREHRRSFFAFMLVHAGTRISCRLNAN